MSNNNSTPVSEAGEPSTIRADGLCELVFRDLQNLRDRWVLLSRGDIKTLNYFGDVRRRDDLVE